MCRSPKSPLIMWTRNALRAVCSCVCVCECWVEGVAFPYEVSFNLCTQKFCLHTHKIWRVIKYSRGVNVPHTGCCSSRIIVWNWGECPTGRCPVRVYWKVHKSVLIWCGRKVCFTIYDIRFTIRYSTYCTSAKHLLGLNAIESYRLILPYHSFGSIILWSFIYQHTLTIDCLCTTQLPLPGIILQSRRSPLSASRNKRHTSIDLYRIQ